jgi:hypothetical protein
MKLLKFTPSEWQTKTGIKITGMPFISPDSSLNKIIYSCGGWVAGGFVRNALLGKEYIDYLSKNGGDIDFFFSSSDAANEAIEKISHINTIQKFEHSIGHAAMETLVSNNTSLFKIQLVNKPQLCMPNIESSLNIFDIFNACVAFDGEYFHVPEGWLELELQKSLKVLNNNSPILGHRISKYLQQKGLENICDESISLVEDWLAMCVANKFDHFYNRDQATVAMKASVMALFEKKNCKIDRKNILMFIGMWNVYYNDYTLIDGLQKQDWALNALASEKEK